jgi:formamidopyrimidine-DNA glycosylase
MPEGPEVETIRRGLESAIPGQNMRVVDVVFAGSFQDGHDNLSAALIGGKVLRVVRRGKVLVIELANGWAFMIHLKMTGQLVLVRADGDRLAGGHPTPSMGGELPDKSTRVIFGFELGDTLYFNDQRKFGWIKLVPVADVDHDALVSKLGPEVLSAEFDVAYLANALSRHGRAPVKAVILDQAIVAGVGNIYADESLHLAKIHPARRAGSLTADEILRLHTAMGEIIASGIERGGTSFSHYVTSLGGRGDYLDVARVFRRNGHNCPVCGTEIEKIRVAGRGTHICPVCQPLEGSM